MWRIHQTAHAAIQAGDSVPLCSLQQHSFFPPKAVGDGVILLASIYHSVNEVLSLYYPNIAASALVKVSKCGPKPLFLGSHA